MSKKRGRPKKDERLEEIRKNFNKVKSDRLEKIANKLLEQDEQIQRLKGIKTKGKFLDLF